MKNRLKNSGGSLVDVLHEGRSNEVIGKMRVVDLLCSVPGLGKVRARQMMDRLGIEPKIISGDNPHTVAALLAQLDIKVKGGVISGAELEAMITDPVYEGKSLAGLIDLVRDGDDGLIVDYADAAGLRRAVRWVLDNPDAARRMGRRAHESAARFTTERTMRAVYEIVTGQDEVTVEEPDDARLAARV